MKVWLILIACFAIFAAANWQGISDTEVDQAVAEDKSQALADAAQVAFGKHPGLYWEGL